MQQLMIKQHKLILKNSEIIFKQYLEMRVIEQSHALETNFQDTFLYEASKVLCGKGYRLINKSYTNTSLIIRKVLDDQSLFLYVQYSIKSSL